MRAASCARIACGAIALHSLGSLLAAQEVAQSSVAEASRCDVLPATADSADVEVHLALGPAELPLADWYGERRRISQAQARRFGVILDAFRARFPVQTLVAPPLTQPLDAADFDYVKSADASVPSLWNRTLFTLRGNGRLSAVDTDYASRSRALDALIMHTLEALDAEGVLASLPGDTATGAPVERDPLPLRLEIGYTTNKAVATTSLGWIRAPRYDIEPSVVIEGFPTPKFPDDLRERYIEGGVLVQLIVDSSGRPDMRSAAVLRATHFGFARAVFDVLPEFRFHAARINGCPAKQLVQMPFAFRLRR